MQWIAVALSLLGAWYVGSRSRHYRRIGFMLWVWSNFFWIAVGFQEDLNGLIIQNSIFLITSVRGWANNKTWHVRINEDREFKY